MIRSFKRFNTADPAPKVHKDALYLFSSHDEDVGEANDFTMKNRVLTTATCERGDCERYAEVLLPARTGRRSSGRTLSPATLEARRLATRTARIPAPPTQFNSSY